MPVDISVPLNELGISFKDDIGVPVYVTNFMTPAERADTQTDAPTLDHTAAMQSAINAAASDRRALYIPGGKYRFSTLEIARNGQIVSGAGCYVTQLQCISTSGGIVLSDPAGSTELRNPIIENLSIDGMGYGISTMPGIKAAAKADTYNGSFLQLRNVSIRYFDVGLYATHWDQISISGCRLEYNGKNMHFPSGGNVNSVVMIGSATSNAQIEDMLIETGAGITIQGGDHVTQQGIRATGANTQVTVIGGNYENAAGQGAFIAETNATIIGIGNRFLKQGSGAELSPCRAKSNGRILMIAPVKGGYTSPLVYKEASAIVHVFAPNNTHFAGGDDISENGLTKYRGSTLDARVGPNYPGAGSTMRGLMLELMQQDTANLEDRLGYCLRTRTGAYEWYDLIGARQMYSLTGVSHARVSQMRKCTGSIPVTLAAGAYTDITVNIGTFLTLYSVVPTVYDGSGRAIWANGKSNNPSTGDIVIRVHHPSETAGGTTTEIHYNIEVST